MSSKSIERRKKDFIVGAITSVVLIPLLNILLTLLNPSLNNFGLTSVLGTIITILCLIAAVLCLAMAIKLSFDSRNEKIEIIKSQSNSNNSATSLLEKEHQKVKDYSIALLVCLLIVVGAAIYEFISCGLSGGCGNLEGIVTLSGIVIVAPLAIVFLVLYIIAKASYKAILRKTTQDTNK